MDWRGGKKSTCSDPELYSSLERAISSLRLNVIIEADKRISTIKIKTKKAIKILDECIASIRKDAKNLSLNIQSITKLQLLIQGSEFCFKRQIEEFNTNLGVIEKLTAAKDLPLTKSFSLRPDKPAEVKNSRPTSAGLNKQGAWATRGKDGGVHPLPEWVSSQINNGIKFKCQEIMIYQKDKISSIADINHMKYYWAKPDGSKSGAGQDLIRFGGSFRG